MKACHRAIISKSLRLLYLLMKKLMSGITLTQLIDASIISEAYRCLFIFGAEALQLDFNLGHVFNEFK